MRVHLKAKEYEAMQRLVRSIVPRIMKKSFNESEAEDSTTMSKNASKSINSITSVSDVASTDKTATDQTTVSATNSVVNTAQSSSSVVRRRGRRVTRGAGAAGEAMELKVEDTGLKNAEPHTVQVRSIAPVLFQEPVLPVRAEKHDENGEDSRNNISDESSGDSRNKSRNYSDGRNEDCATSRNDRNDRSNRNDRNDRSNRRLRVERRGDFRDDRYADNYRGDTYGDEYEDAYTDNYRGKYADKYAEKYSDKYADKYSDKYDDKYDASRETTRETNRAVSRMQQKNLNRKDKRNSVFDDEFDERNIRDDARYDSRDDARDDARQNIRESRRRHNSRNREDDVFERPNRRLANEKNNGNGNNSNSDSNTNTNSKKNSNNRSANSNGGNGGNKEITYAENTENTENTENAGNAINDASAGSARNARNAGNTTHDIDWYQNRDEQSRKSQRSRRSRRLNAVERRAAAEVEQIEEDLAYDDIVYAPIDTRIDETLDVSDIVDAGGNRRVRRRNFASRDDFDRDTLDDDVADDSRDDSRDYELRTRSRNITASRNVPDSDNKSDGDSGVNGDNNDDNSDNYHNGDDEGIISRRRRRRRSSRANRNADRNTDRGADRSADRNADSDTDRNTDRDSRYNSRDIDEDIDSRINREDFEAVSQEDRDLIPDPDELRAQDEEETLYTRRRRRRRSKSSDDSSSASSSASSSSSLSDDSRNSVDEDAPRRSRKQQYIDEITDIEGSTRLEAKRQRRRDNRRERSRQNLLMEQDFLARRENVDRLMVVRERDRHTQISVIEDNVLVEHYVSDIQEVATVGNIYLGRIQNVLPSMEAAFVDIGQARNGVLYAGEVNWDMTRLEGQPRRIELAFKSGDPVLVQVTKDPIGHKGARLTSQVTLAGRFLVLVPSGGMTGVSRKLSDRERSRLRAIVAKIAPNDMGIIIRTAAEGASEEAIQKDLESLIKQWNRIEAKRQEYLHGKRPKLLQGEPDVAIRVVRDIFNDDFQKLIVEGEGVHHRIDEYLEMMAPDLRSKVEYWDPADHEGKDVFDKWQIDSQLRKGMERQVYLPAGGSIVIDRTEAMTTIDVNTGRFIGRGKSLEETVTRCNLEASEEIARQLRLRDIGGMVMIDYVDMVMPANRDLVLRRLLECLSRDRTKHQVAEVTSLGLVQMTRKRVGQGLVEAFSEECPTCKGRGFILHDEPTVSSEYADPYALKGGDPFVKTNKYGHGSATEQPAPVKQQTSSADVRAKLARIAAASVITDAAHRADEEVSDTGLENLNVVETDGTAVEAEETSAESTEVKAVAESTEFAEVTETAGAAAETPVEAEGTEAKAVESTEVAATAEEFSEVIESSEESTAESTEEETTTEESTEEAVENRMETSAENNTETAL